MTNTNDHAHSMVNDNDYQRPRILRQNSIVTQCSDDIQVFDALSEDKRLKDLRVELRNQDGPNRYLSENVPEYHQTVCPHGHAEEITDGCYVDIQNGQRSYECLPFVDDSDHVNETAPEKSLANEKKANLSFVDIVAELSRTKTDARWLDLFQELIEKLCVNETEKSVEIPVYTSTALREIMGKHGVVHLSLHRRSSIVVTDIEYRHHRLLIKDSLTTYKEYESLGDFKNLLKLQSISHFKQYERTIGDLDDSSLYDFEQGVFVVVHPEFYKEAKPDLDVIKHRAEYCTQLLDKYYYLFSSMNCENVVNYIMTGRGYSKQLDAMSAGMWAFCDIMDNFCYYKDIIILLMSYLLLNISVSFVFELVLVYITYEDEQENRSLQLKQGVYSERHVFKMAFSFLSRLLFVTFGLTSIFALCLALVFSPVIFGAIFDFLVLERICQVSLSKAKSSVLVQFTWKGERSFPLYTQVRL